MSTNRQQRIGGLADAIPLEEVQRILVIKLRNHGDVLLASPVPSLLKQAAPHVEIDALVYQDTAEMLSGHPALSRLFCIDRKWKKLPLRQHLAAEIALYKEMRARGYDLLINLTEHRRGAWLARLLKVRWAVAPRTAAKDRFTRKSYTHLVAYPATGIRHVVETEIDALRRIGIYPQPQDCRLTLTPGAEAESVVAAHLERLNLANRRFVHVHPCSRWGFKCLPITTMARIIDAMQEAGWPVLITAAPDPDELRMVDAIRGALQQPAACLAGELSLKQLAALTSRATLFLGVDSAPMHIAAAVGTPVVALFGPSADYSWGPWGVPHRVVASQVHPCRPCRIAGCGNGKVSDCLETLSAEQVLAAFHDLATEVGAHA